MSKDIKQVIGTNYHNSLLKLKDHFDPVLTTFQHHYAEQQAKGFVVPLLLKPLADIPLLIKAIKSLDFKNLNISAVPIIGAMIAPFVTAHFKDGWILPVVGSTISFIGLYLCLLPKYFWEMSLLESRHFHIGVYYLLRKKEYQLFERSFLFEDFSFEGLFYFVNGILTQQDRTNETVDKLIHEYDSYRVQLHERMNEKVQDVRDRHQEKIETHQQEINRLSSEMNNLVDEQVEMARETDKTIDSLVEQAEESDKINGHLIDLLNRANTVLNRLNQETFKVSDLRILTPFTLYELHENQLKLIADEGTNSTSPKFIKLDHPNFGEWAAVVAVNEHATDATYNIPRENYYIVSYRMDMNDGKGWVYNFHIDSLRNKDALDLTIGGIIESSKVFKLIHALCLLLQKQGFPNEEGKVDAKTSA